MSTKEKDITVTKQIEHIANEICDKYCKYPQEVHEKWLKEEIEERDEYLMEHHCNDCPLMRLF